MRKIAPTAALAAAVGLVVSQASPVQAQPSRPAIAVLAPGSSGSLQHHPWWDPRGWFAGSGPRPRVLASNVAAVPHRIQLPRQAAMPPVHRVQELTSQRSEYSRVYRLADGQTQAVLSAVPVNYRDSSGHWRPVDVAVSRAARPGFSYANQTNTFRSYFGRTAGRLMRLQAPGGGWLSIALGGARPAHPRVTGSTVSYRRIMPGAGLVYQVTPTALEERVTLTSPAVPSLHYTITVGGGLVPSQRPDGSLVFSRHRAGGAPVLIMPDPVMTDARPDASSPYGTSWSPAVSQHATWDPATGVVRLTVTPDGRWLRVAGRSFPVVVNQAISIVPPQGAGQYTMISSDPGAAATNFSATGQLPVGTGSRGADRALVEFPLGPVPAGTELQTADLELYHGRSFGRGTSPETVEAHQATAPWDGATATWDTASKNVGQLGRNQVMADASNTAATAADGAWQTAVSPAGFGGQYRFNQDSVPGDTFTWLPQLTESGSYRVAAHYVAAANAATAAPYTVHYRGGARTYLVNQQAGSGGRWAALGTHRFAAGNIGKVVLADGPATTSTRVEADAVRLTKPGSVAVDPAARGWDEFSVRNIVQAWLDGTGHNYGFVVKAADENRLNQGGPAYAASSAAGSGATAAYPRLVLTYVTPGVIPGPITTIHATGAALSWPAYPDPTPGRYRGDDIAGYQVYRGVSPDFQPSAATLIASVPAGATTFTDTTATPTAPGRPAASVYYMVAVKTAGGRIIPGPVQRAKLPTAGSTVRITGRPGKTHPVTGLRATPQDTYYVPDLPDPLTASHRYTVRVTLTNTTASAWKASDWVLSYHWLLPGGADVSGPRNQARTTLPANMSPGAVATVAAALKAPGGIRGRLRAGYVLAWDLYNKTTGSWLSSGSGAGPAGKPGLSGPGRHGSSGARPRAQARVAPLTQLATVEQPSSGQLGLERFYQYTGVNTGSGSAVLDNLANGTAVWSYNAFSNPSHGFATFVRMAYNSMDTSDSAMGFGWSLEASTVQRLGTPLEFNLPFDPTEVTLTDGDGTSHEFILGSGGGWRSPPGIHLFLQHLADCDPFSETDNPRAWVMTRPDRTQFFFDCEGYQTAVVDRNGNTTTFTYSQRDSLDRQVKFLTSITDPAGRQTLTINYYTAGGSYQFIDDHGDVATGAHLLNPFIIDRVSSITDISGRTITFLYDQEGRMARMIDGDGTPLAKVFKFGYGDPLNDDSLLLTSVTDPRGNATGLAYNLPQSGGDPAFWFALKTITDRGGGTVGFTYSRPLGSSQTQTRVTDQNRHTTTYVLDSAGRPVRSVNALGQVTKLTYDGDNNVISLTEDNGATTTWTYDPNTGYPLSMTDALASKNGTAPTTYAYETGLNGHIADLISELTPQQRLWTFSYDTNGNLTTVRDPNGNAVSPPSGFLTTYTYDATGQLLTATDADGNTTSFSSYDPSGYPQTITDAVNNATRFTYDARGNVTSVTDPLGHVTTQSYDVFGRPGQNVVPKDQAAGDFVTTPAPVYDGNDNIVQATAPNGAETTFTYNPNDQLTKQFAPQDSPTSPQRETTYGYDPAGNLTSVTEPDGNVPSPSSSFTTTYSYDAINELASQTDAAGGRTTYGYDDVGNMTSLTDPVENATPGNTTAYATYTYDLDHRPTSVKDAAGFTTSQTYDLDGLVKSRTNQNGDTTLYTLDPGGRMTQMMVPHDTSGGNIVYNTTQFAYDQAGNQIKVVTPRGVASGIPGAYTVATRYDADNRVAAQLSAFNPNDPVYNTPAETDYSYDPAGRLTQVSAPPSGGQTLRNVTNYAYFDNGWLKSATDPWGITTSYDYNRLGEQTSRTITSAGGFASRTMGWAYYLDGKLQSRSDQGVPSGLAAELVDNSDFNNTSATGTWTTSSAGSGFQGPDYQTHDPGTGNDTFTWNLNIPQDGNYTVYVKYPAVSGAATDAAFKVSFSGGSSTVPVDQTQNAGTWVPLGKFAFTQNGTGQNVSLSENSGGTVVADAVAVVRDNSADPPQNNFGYRYDPNGNLTEITDSTPGAAIDDYQLSYDGLNRVTQVAELAAGAVKHTTSYGYDANSDLTSRGHDGAISTYSYDPRNLLSKEADAQSAADPSPQVSTFSYTPAGQLATEVKPNGNTLTNSYFADLSLQHSIETTPAGAAVDEHTYTYDPNGNKTQDVEKLMSADDSATYLTHTLGYTYDPRDRIAQVTKDGAVTESYTHDANDNVTSQTIDGVSTVFNYDRNRLLSTVTNGATAGYNYDPFGRLDTVTPGGQVQESNTYDGFDRLIQHQQLNASGSMDVTAYTYDPIDRMTSQTTGVGTSSPQTTDYAYLGLSNELITELQNGVQTKSYTYTPGGMRLSQTITNGNGTQTPGYYTYNDHSDVEAVTGSNGNTQATYGYTAYGQNDPGQFTGKDKNNTQPGSTAQPFNAYRYDAMRWDSSSGQYDMGFRNYDPALNQFLSRDMFVGALADMSLDTDPFTGNRYTFASGNPISNIDLTGHRACSSANITPDCDTIHDPGAGQAQEVARSQASMGQGGTQGGAQILQFDPAKLDKCLDPNVLATQCDPQTMQNLQEGFYFCLSLADNPCGIDYGALQKALDMPNNPLRRLFDVWFGGHDEGQGAVLGGDSGDSGTPGVLSATDNGGNGSKGGSYGALRRLFAGVKDTEIHHLIPTWVLEALGIDKNDGPSVSMTKADHRDTNTWGSYTASKQTRQQMLSMLQSGDISGAMNVSLQDLEKFGSTYMEAANEALRSQLGWMFGGLFGPKG